MLWRMLTLSETLQNVCLLNTRGLGVVWRSFGQSIGCVLWWFGEEEGEVFFGEAGFGARCSCGVPKARQEGRVDP